MIQLTQNQIKTQGKQLRFCLLLLIALLLIAIVTTVARAEGFYAGVGGSWAVENFDNDYDINHQDTDDSYGLNAKLGYHINDQFALEFGFDYLPSLDVSGTIPVIYLDGEVGDPTVDVSNRINTYILSLKYSPNFYALNRVKPFVTAGIGGMHLSSRVTVDTYPGSYSLRETDWCAKAGVGVDYFLTDNFSTGVEVDYIWGFDDLDDVEYMNVSAGLAYHF